MIILQIGTVPLTAAQLEPTAPSVQLENLSAFVLTFCAPPSQLIVSYCSREEFVRLRSPTTKNNSELLSFLLFMNFLQNLS